MLGSDFCPIKQGQTEESARINPSMKGAEFEVANLATDGSRPDGRSRRVVICLNASGGALLPGRGFKFKSTAPGYEVTAHSGAGEKCDGVVDPLLPAAGVANGKAFLGVVEGPIPNATSDGAAVLAFNDHLVTGALGKFTKQTAAPANETAVMVQVNAKSGYSEGAATNVDGTLFAMYFRRS